MNKARKQKVEREEFSVSLADVKDRFFSLNGEHPGSYFAFCPFAERALQLSYQRTVVSQINSKVYEGLE